MKQKILILGAGELGTAILNAFIWNGNLTATESILTVAVRNPIADDTSPRTASLRSLLSQNIQFTVLDIATCPSAELEALFANHTTLIGCLGFAAGAGVQRKIAAAALAARVPRYIPWQFGIDYDVIGRGSTQPLFDEQVDVREMLRAQRGTEWMIVQTGVFTSFMFEPAWGVVDMERHKVRALGSWETSISATAPEDIGRCVAALVLDEGEWEKYKNGLVNVAGDTRTYGEIAAIVEKIAQEKGSKAAIVREEWTVPYLTEQWRKDSEDVINRYRPVFAAGIGVAWDMHDTYNYTRGFHTTTIEDFARAWMS